MNTPHKSRAIQTQTCLREALSALLLVKPLSEISIRELTENAQVSRSTFYLHYDSIYDMVRSIEDDMLSDYREGLQAILGESSDPRTLVEKLFAFSFRHKYENLPYSKTLYLNTGSSELISRYTKIALEELSRFFPGKLDDTAMMVLNFYLSGIISLIHEWILGDMARSPEEMSRFVLDIIRNGDRYLNLLTKP